MIRRVLVVALWLACGGAVIGGFYWLFLGTPESSTLMLAVSAVLLIAMGFIAAVVGNAGLLLAFGESPIASVKRATRYAYWFLLPLAVVVLGVVATRYVDGWLARASGEIGAWFIATFDWADVTFVFRAAAYLSEWLRWVFVPLAALAVLAAVLRRGGRVLTSTRWVRAAWGWRTVLIATAVYVLCFALPWLLASWRPEELPPTWVEPALAGLKLFLVGAAMAIGAAVVVVVVARAVEAATPPAG